MHLGLVTKSLDILELSEIRDLLSIKGEVVAGEEVGLRELQDVLANIMETVQGAQLQEMEIKRSRQGQESPLPLTP